MVVFALAIFLVFLVLAAQYESWGLPFSVLLGTPFAAFGAYLGLWLARQFSTSYVNNVFAQIGLIMLIGLAAKNAILIVEFAKMLHEQGKDPFTAALEAARLRFRPILMTAFAFILGVVPLAHRERRRRRGPEGDGHGGLLRHARRDVPRRVSDSRALRDRREDGRVRSRRASRGTRRDARSEGVSRGMRSHPRAAIHLAIAGALFSGCATGPDYERPEMSPPAAYRDATGLPVALSVADVPWWQVFGDEALQALIRDAVAYNHDLRIATARVQEARALAGVAKSFLYPEVNLTAGYTGNQVSRNAEAAGVEHDTDRTFNSTRSPPRCRGSWICSGVSAATARPPSPATWRPRKAAGPSSSRS